MTTFDAITVFGYHLWSNTESQTDRPLTDTKPKMSYRGYQSTIGGDERNEWSRLSQTVAQNVQKISQNG